jgi:hypothetical protein
MVPLGVIAFLGMIIPLRLALKREGAIGLDPPAEVVRGTRSVDLLFPGVRGGLARETREIVAGDNLEEDVRLALEKLVGGSRTGARALPATTRVLNVFHDGDGEVTVNFSDHLRLDHPGGSAAEFATLRCIVSTIGANFPGTDRVRILIDGERVKSLAGHSDLTRSLKVEDYR